MDPFETFYATYPRKVGRQAALKAWQKLKPDVFLVKEIMDGLEAAKPGWEGKEIDFIPHPATWLNNRRWEDVPAPKTQPVIAEGRPNFFTSLPKFEEPTDEERAYWTPILKAKVKEMVDKLDMRARLRLRNKISPVND